MRKKQALPVLEKVSIIDIASEGKSVARVDELVIFVLNAVPGDLADIRLTRKKSSYAEGEAIHFHQYSPLRTEPFCEHFGICGGCKWQHLSYEAQLKFKQKQVEDALRRLAKVTLPDIEPILGSEKTAYYRNKLEFTFSNKKWLTKPPEAENPELQMNALGFHIPKRFDKILDINHCHLQPDPSNAIRNSIKAYALAHHLTFFDLKAQTGLLRNLIIRTGMPGELMAIMVFAKPDPEATEGLMKHLAETFPEITSLLYVVNEKRNDTITDQEVFTYKGRDHIFEEMEGIRFRISPKSFYQTNSQQAYNLYRIARDFAGLSGRELVYDLYTGAGTIANFVAGKAKKVIGIEYIQAAIEDARLNSGLNRITNTTFLAGDMKDILTADFIGSYGQPDVIITDPPRAGMHEDVTLRIKEAGAGKIVYISCNPATQARDIALLDEAYAVKKVQPVDMFPHTHHVENIVLLEKRT